MLTKEERSKHTPVFLSKAWSKKSNAIKNRLSKKKTNESRIKVV